MYILARIRLLGRFTTCRANNNRFAVVVCFRLAFNASGMRFFLEICDLKIFVHYDDVIIRWWVSIFEICVGYHFSIIRIHIVLRFRFSISYGVWDISIYVTFNTFKNVTIRHNSIKCVKNFPRLELLRSRPKIYPHAKNQPWGLPVSSINFVHIYIPGLQPNSWYSF